MPGPGRGGSGEPRLLRTNGACERAVCLRYGRLVTDLVDGRLLALLTTRYGASRSHISPAKRYLGCELVDLCVLTLGYSKPSCGVKMNAPSCLLAILSAGLTCSSRVASLSLGLRSMVRIRSSNSSSVPPKRLRGGAGHVLGHAACQPPREPPSAGRAHHGTRGPSPERHSGTARIRGGHEVVALVRRGGFRHGWGICKNAWSEPCRPIPASGQHNAPGPPAQVAPRSLAAKRKEGRRWEPVFLAARLARLGAAALRPASGQLFGMKAFRG